MIYQLFDLKLFWSSHISLAHLTKELQHYSSAVSMTSLFCMLCTQKRYKETAAKIMLNTSLLHFGPANSIHTQRKNTPPKITLSFNLVCFSLEGIKKSAKIK